MCKQLMAVLVVAIALVGLSLCGCGGGDDDGAFVVPAEFVGTWAAVGYDPGGNPSGGGVFNVDDEGNIYLQEFDGAAVLGGVTTAQSGTLVGTITSESGSFRIQMSEDGTTTTVTGDLDTDDTGSGTWRGGGESGPVDLWRANGTGTAYNLSINITGDATGTGNIAVGADGVVSGTVTVGGTTYDVHGVVTGDGQIAAGVNDEDIFVLIEGTASSTSASGTWKNSDGSDGTWTATFG